MLTKDKNKNELLVRDPICGMWIEPEYAADVDFYKGKIFYFCAPVCKKEFEANPEKFINSPLGNENDNEQFTKK